MRGNARILVRRAQGGIDTCMFQLRNMYILGDSEKTRRCRHPEAHENRSHWITIDSDASTTFFLMMGPRLPMMRLTHVSFLSTLNIICGIPVYLSRVERHEDNDGNVGGCA